MGAISHEKSSDVSIRRFRPEDLEVVQRLYKETRFYGAGSPTRIAISRALLSFTAYALYFSFFAGLCVILQNPSGKWRYMGIAITVISGLLLASMIIPIGMFIFFGLRAYFKGDMKDVATFYRLRESQKDEAGASSFWVAEVETGVQGQKEVVGCVGLDYFSSEDKTEAELKRMLVAPGFRGRGIAKKLMEALLDHAREHKLKEVYLQTTGLNDKAVIMYKKTGWYMAKREVFRAGLMTGEGYIFRWKLDGQQNS
ncbi:hypothetical protein PQX77_013558 [Marasmius sp. AFHP31]|nr:hypothetical protein PQX77_013558 [Marasmius sp. AFHP31]